MRASLAPLCYTEGDGELFSPPLCKGSQEAHSVAACDTGEPRFTLIHRSSPLPIPKFRF